ncbi:RDD family protein [Streptomyces avermitilis]|uniref:RDD family protein n=1 Tax=Streptomyces avermitilis TaxID=33903 RepID=UPI0033A9C052
MSFGAPDNPYGQPQNPQQGYGYPQQGQPPYPQAPGGIPQQGYGYPQQGQPGYGYPGGPGPRVASMGRRLGARAIDGVAFFVIYFILGAIGVAGSIGAAQDCDPNAADYNTCINNAGSDIAAKIGSMIAVLAIVGLLYEWLMTGLVGATLGKLAVGIRVVKADTGQKPGLGSSFIRWIIPLVGSLACGIGQVLVYLSPFWDKSGRQQGWHDKAAGTMVIQN